MTSRQKNDPKPRQSKEVRQLVRALSQLKLELNASEKLQYQEDDEKVTPQKKFEQELNPIEARTNEIKKWVDETNEKFKNLPDESGNATFEHILIMIAPERIQKIGKLVGELKILIDKRTRLAEANQAVAQEYFQNRVWNLVKTEREAQRELKKIKKKSHDMIGKAAVQFKKNLPNFIKDYWEDAKATRDLLAPAMDASLRGVPEEFRSVEEGKEAVAEVVEAQKTTAGLKDKIQLLTKMGGFIGKLRSQATQDVKFNSEDLKVSYDNTVEKLEKLKEKLEAKLREKERIARQAEMQVKDVEHNDMYLEIFTWVDEQLGVVSKYPASGKLPKLATFLEDMNTLLDEDLPMQEEIVDEHMADMRLYLVEHQYQLANRVVQREEKLKEVLKDLQRKATEERDKAGRLILGVSAQDWAMLRQNRYRGKVVHFWRLRSDSLKQITSQVLKLDVPLRFCTLIAAYCGEVAVPDHAWQEEEDESEDELERVFSEDLIQAAQEHGKEASPPISARKSFRADTDAMSEAMKNEMDLKVKPRRTGPMTRTDSVETYASDEEQEDTPLPTEDSETPTSTPRGDKATTPQAQAELKYFKKKYMELDFKVNQLEKENRRLDSENKKLKQENAKLRVKLKKKKGGASPTTKKGRKGRKDKVATKMVSGLV